MGFFEYKPSIVYEPTADIPETLDINRNYGHYDQLSYEHACFYNGDYIETRKIIAEEIAIITDIKKVPEGDMQVKYDLYDIFLKSKLHVFRAVEPALKSRFRLINCNPLTEENTYKRCLLRRGEALGSRSQLAKLVLEQQAKENKLGDS